MIHIAILGEKPYKPKRIKHADFRIHISVIKEIERVLGHLPKHLFNHDRK